MRTALLALLLLLAVSHGAFGTALAEPFAPGRSFNQPLVADVTATALAFMAPRTLEPIPLSKMAEWGLRGLAALDPRMSPELREGRISMSTAQRPVYSRAMPEEGDPAGWGEAIAQTARVAWDGSEAVRRAGTYGILRSFFDELFNHYDPYSRYSPPEEAAEDRDRRDGRAGTGLRVARRGGAWLVQSVAPDSPADEAGVRPGDRLLAVEDEPLEGEDLPSVEEMLAGPEDSRVAITLRGRDGRPRTVELTRVLIVSPSVAASQIGGMLVIRVGRFSVDTASRLARELTRGLAGPRPPRGVVLDLRGNRGGLLRQAVSAAETLLRSGVIAVTAGRAPEAGHDFVASGEDLARGLPVVVVVDGRSASSAEILAAALADQHRAVVVGSTTLGKGLVQTAIALPDGGELYVTWSRVLAPLGWPLQGLGVLPQLCTSLGQDATTRAMSDLAAGRQPLARALARNRAARAPVPSSEILEIRNACPAAEGRDADLSAARWLIEHPQAYATALIGPPPP